MESLDSQTTTSIGAWKEGVISEDLAAVENILARGVRSEHKLPEELSQRLVQAGGKRIRPLLLSLCYRSLQEQFSDLTPRASEEDIHTLAAVAEWVHTATLFHDDVIDASPTRRNLHSAHVVHGNKVAILIGDFVYAEAFALLMDRGLLAPSQKLAYTIKRLVEGELWQHSYAINRRISLNEYEKVAECKTAALFAWATETGVWASGSINSQEGFEFGRHLGIAFQMADDLLDTYSLNVKGATHAELVEWFNSAPPLPLCVAHKKEIFSEGLWSSVGHVDNFEALQMQVLNLQNACCHPDVLTECKLLLSLHLDKARDSLSVLGNPQKLLQSVDIIEARAHLGFQTAEKLYQKGI